MFVCTLLDYKRIFAVCQTKSGIFSAKWKKTVTYTKQTIILLEYYQKRPTIFFTKTNIFMLTGNNKNDINANEVIKLNLTKATITIWRSYIMARNTMSVIKGVGAGLATGMVVGFVGSVMLKDNKKYKKKTAKAISTVEDLIDGVKDIFD